MINKKPKKITAKNITEEEIFKNGLVALDDANSYFMELKNNTINEVFTNVCSELLFIGEQLLKNEYSIN